MLTTVMPPLVPPMPTTVTAIHIEEQDYSDEQFYADVRKAGKRLDAMEAKARQEYAQGKTRKFPTRQIEEAE